MKTLSLRPLILRLSLAVAIVAGAVWLGRLIVLNALSDSLMTYVERTPTLSNEARRQAMDLAVKYTPDNPMAHLQRGGNYLTAAVEEGNEDWAGVSLWEIRQAARMSPEDYRIWLALGRALDRTGRSNEAREAYDRAMRLSPNYFDTHWALGNHLLRAGDREGAFVQMRQALALRPSAFSLIFDYAWEAYRGDALAIARALEPGPEIMAEMAALLVRRDLADAGLQVWRQIAAPSPDDVRRFAASLIQAGRHGSAYQIWDAAALPEEDIPDPGSLLANGGFEKRIQLNQEVPFHSWRIGAGGGVRVTVDRKDPREGSQSLRVSFSLENNQPVTVASQTVPARPNQSYCLTFYLRTEELKSLSLPLVELYDAASPQRAYAATAPFSGEFPKWTEQSLRIRTAAATEAVTVRLQRPPCADPLCSIDGRLWLDGFKLTACDDRAKGTPGN